MSSPTDRRYTETHEWLRLQGDLATCGITDHAQEQLGDVVHVELPEVDDELGGGEQAAEVESVKAVSDIYSPVSGVVVEVNGALDEQPELLNSDPHGEGWLFKVRVSDAAQVAELLDAGAYDAYVAAQEH